MTYFQGLKPPSVFRRPFRAKGDVLPGSLPSCRHFLPAGCWRSRNFLDRFGFAWLELRNMKRLLRPFGMRNRSEKERDR